MQIGGKKKRLNEVIDLDDETDGDTFNNQKSNSNFS
jgi:hypothetical protein